MNEMLLELYERAYSKISGQFKQHDEQLDSLNFLAPDPGLVEFAKQDGGWRDNLRVLELGCGARTIAQYLDQPFASWLALDFSSVALTLAQKSCTDMRIKFAQKDVTKLAVKNDFDLILDAHTFHCHPSKKLAQMALGGALRALAPGGRLLIETMVSGPLMELPFDFSWDGESVYQKMQGEWHPVRLLLDPDELQSIFQAKAKELECQLVYFTVMPFRRMRVSERDPDYDNWAPNVARAILFKK